MASMLDRITVDPNKCCGRPCIRGLRVRVKDVLDMLAGGSSRAEILRDYQYLEDDDITAALEFASRATDHPVLGGFGEVKFLIDANLPPAFAEWLASEGHEAHHVSDLGLEAMPDREI